MVLKPTTDMAWRAPSEEELAAERERLLRKSRGEEPPPASRPKTVHVYFELSPEEAERLRQLGGEDWLRSQLAAAGPNTAELA